MLTLLEVLEKSRNKKVQVRLVRVVLKILCFEEEVVFFGPRSRSYDQKLNKNVKRIARRSALSIKAKEKSVLVVEDFTFDTPKTASFKAVLKALGIENKKSLFVLGASNNNVYLSARNLERSKVITNSELNTYGIMNTQQLVLLESAVSAIESNLS